MSQCSTDSVAIETAKDAKIRRQRTGLKEFSSRFAVGCSACGCVSLLAVLCGSETFQTEVQSQLEGPLHTTSAAENRNRLLRVLGVGFGLAVIIGNTIGAGIFRAPGAIAEQLPNPWLFLGVWILGGVYALLGAISLAELGAMIPRSGGQYVFARYALGEYAGFIVGWSDWISTCGSAAAVSLLIGQFAGLLFPALNGKIVVVASTVVIAKPVLIAATVAIVFAIVQWRGIIWGSTTQNVTSLLKTLAFLTLVAAAFVFGGQGSLTTATGPAIPAGFTLITALVLSLQSVIYTYDGWNGVVYFSEEITDPGRDIPRAMFGGVFLVIGIYLLVNLALLYVLPISKIRRTGVCRGCGSRSDFRPSRQHNLPDLNDSFDAQRHQCLPPDGHAGAVCDKSRWTVS